MKLVRNGLVMVMAIGVLGMYAVALGASTTTTWNGVTGALLSTSEQSGADWKSWYQPNCEPQRAVVVDHNVREEQDVCVVSSNHARLAVYQGSGTALYALQRDADTEYYRISSLTKDVAHLMLLPNDTLLGVSMQSSLFAYKMANFSAHVTESQIAVGPNIYNKVYNLDMQAAELLTDSQGRYLPVRYIAVSKNNKYAALQVLGGGIVRLSLETDEVKLVSRDVLGYVNAILAISSDGAAIALTGDATVPQRIYTDIERCGADVVFNESVSYSPCPYVDYSDQITSLLATSTIYNPELDETSLTLQAWNEFQLQSYEVVLRPDPDRYRLDYLAMGDSYSSGEGDAGRNYYLPGTDNPPDTCHISSRSYPFLLRDTWNLNSSRMRSVACSGARVVYDYHVSLASYQGQNQRLLGRSDIASIRATALSQFTPGHVPQVEFVKKYQPRVLTLTGGGNDVGFADILKYCATPYWEDVIPVLSDCGYAKQGSQLEQLLYNSIDTQYGYNKSMIQALQVASPATKIVIIGYPSFIADKSATGCALNSGSLTRAEIWMINRMVDRMNTMLEGLAHDTRVNYVDITDSLNGGRICEGSKYMSGVWPYVADSSNESAMFHPNSKGHQRIAQAIADKYSFNTLTVPSQSNYTSITHVVTVILELVQGGISFIEDALRMQAASGTFAANSQYSVTIHSNPVELGWFTAKSDGSLEQAVSLQGVAPGRHVLVVEGTAPDGMPKRLYQFIEVHATAGDADGDGIKNDVDRCQFIPSWIDEQTGEDVCSMPTTPDILPISVLPDNGGWQGAPALVSDSVLTIASPISRSVDTADALGKEWSVASSLPTSTQNTAQTRSAGNDYTYTLWLGAVCVIMGGIMWWRIHARSTSK